MKERFPTPRQLKEVSDFLRVNVGHPHTLMKIHSIYVEWCFDEKIEKKLSYETIRKWYRGAYSPSDTSESFYSFIKTDPFASEYKNPERSFVDGAVKLFGSSNSLDASHLHGLTNRHPDHRLPDRGKFYIIRKLWYPRITDRYLRCIVWFENEGGILKYFEKEDFVSEYRIYEEYEGYAFTFNASVWVMAHEKNSRAVKFLTIHDCHPPLSENVTVNVCKGNLIAVSGRGPNIGNRFVLRRINPGQSQTCCTFDKEKVDKDDLDYLNSDYGI